MNMNFDEAHELLSEARGEVKSALDKICKLVTDGGLEALDKDLHPALRQAVILLTQVDEKLV